MDVPSLQTLTASNILGEKIDEGNMNIILRNLLDEPIGKTVYEQKKLEEARKMFLEDPKLLSSFLLAKHALRTLQPEEPGIYRLPDEAHTFLNIHYHPLVQDVSFHLAKHLFDLFKNKGRWMCIGGTEEIEIQKDGTMKMSFNPNNRTLFNPGELEKGIWGLTGMYLNAYDTLLHDYYTNKKAMTPENRKIAEDKIYQIDDKYKKYKQIRYLTDNDKRQFRDIYGNLECEYLYYKLLTY